MKYEYLVNEEIDTQMPQSAARYLGSRPVPAGVTSESPKRVVHCLQPQHNRLKLQIFWDTKKK